MLITYRSGFDPFVGTECVVRSGAVRAGMLYSMDVKRWMSAQVEGSECIVTKAKGNDRREDPRLAPLDTAERWCGTYKKRNCEVVDRPKISDDKEESSTSKLRGGRPQAAEAAPRRGTVAGAEEPRDRRVRHAHDERDRGEAT